MRVSKKKQFSKIINTSYTKNNSNIVIKTEIKT